MSSHVRPSCHETFGMAKVDRPDLCTQLLNAETRECTVEPMTTIKNRTSLDVDLSANPEKLWRERMHSPDLEPELGRTDPVRNRFHYG